MGTQGVGTFAINSFWESGRLIFYEKAYGHTTTGDVFILGADYVQVGDTANDVDFKYYGTGSLSAIIDCSAATFTFTNIALKSVGLGMQFGTPTYSAGGCADGAGIPLDTGYSGSASNRYSAFEVVADTGATDLTGDTYEAAIHGKLNIGTSQSNASLIAGLFSLDVADDKNFSGGNYFALRGHLDFWDDSTFSGVTHVGAISAYVENESTTTIGAGTYLYGVDVYQVGAPTNSGSNPAINIRASSTASKWEYGVYMNPLQVKQAVRVGTASETATAIVDGAGLSLATGYAGGSSNRLYAVDINADTGSTNLTGDTMEGAVRGRTVIGTTQTNCSLYGTHGVIDVGLVSIQGNFAGVYGVLDFYRNATMGSGAACYGAGIIATVWNEAQTTLGAGAILSGVDIVENGAVYSSGSGALNPAINVRGSWTSVFNVSAAACYAANTTAIVVAPAYDIVVTINGTVGYIPVWTDRTWGS